MNELPPAPPGSWIPWLALVVALLAPLGPVWLANRNAHRAATVAAQTAAKIDRESNLNRQRLDAIHQLVDGRLSAALEKIDALEQHLLETEGREPTGEPPATPRPGDSYPKEDA